METEAVMVNPITSNSLSRLRSIGESDPMQTKGGAAPSGPQRGPAGNTSDGVSLSAEAMRLPEALTKGPPIDRALVERIGTAIAEGRYPIKPDLIADALVRDGYDMQL
jgi:flagellar biosynthesis anti-sigma factor FlgM